MDSAIEGVAVDGNGKGVSIHSDRLLHSRFTGDPISLDFGQSHVEGIGGTVRKGYSHFPLAFKVFGIGRQDGWHEIKNVGTDMCRDENQKSENKDGERAFFHEDILRQ